MFCVTDHICYYLDLRNVLGLFSLVKNFIQSCIPRLLNYY